MIRLPRNGIKTVLALCYLAWSGLQAQCQELNSTLSIASQRIADTLAKPKGNSPERGELSLDAFKGPAFGKKFTFKFNRHLSILNTDVDTVSQIKFSEVMEQLVRQNRARGGDPHLTKEMLFHQWWDTNNAKPGLATGPHCDDESAAVSGKPEGALSTLNKFPYRCPRKEGAEAQNNQVFEGEANNDKIAYSAIAVSNRFDLLSDPKKLSNGKVRYPDCGEYRIVFARNSGKSVGSDTSDTITVGDRLQRNLIIFEARIKNPRPRPQAAKEPPVGCMPILKFWQSLSDPALSGKERGKRLHDFYMKGKMAGTGGSIKPVVDIRHYSFGAGQIRTNQFLNDVKTVTPPPVPGPGYEPPTQPPPFTVVEPFDWTLREFRTAVVDKTLLIVPDSAKSTPGTELFRPGSVDARLPLLTRAIRDQIVDILGGETSPGQFGNLDDVNSIKFATLDRGVNAFDSDQKDRELGDILSVYQSGKVGFTGAIQDDLNSVKSKLTPDNIVDRMRTQTCAGCHQFSDTATTVASGQFGFDPKGQLGGKAVWPNKACGDVDPATCGLGNRILTWRDHPPMQFTHISELFLTRSVADGEKRWRYAISLTTECLLDFREKFIKKALGLPPTADNHCPQ